MLATLSGLLAATAYSPLGIFSLSLLERRFPERKDGTAPVAGIVMPDGWIDRFPYDLALAREYLKTRIIFSGTPEWDYEGFNFILLDGMDLRSA